MSTTSELSELTAEVLKHLIGCRELQRRLLHARHASREPASCGIIRHRGGGGKLLELPFVLSETVRGPCNTGTM